ncbi:hypothetical protein DTO212C5_1495 [Paecilomyces variotii]|nr:hypothetical protein DTO212C5_1495 [Paecilomyces variotii]
MLEHQKAQRAHSSSVPSESTRRRIYPTSSDGSMGPSTRLWNRLRDIPNNPNDPECVKELVIVAFGAFERYYICWKIQNGEYRQDSYGLPDELQTWLFPPDGSTRDFDTLQIVFGHGDEYFASDKNGKVSNRDSTADLKDKLSARQVPSRQNLRRSHTLSMTSLPSERELRPPSLIPVTQSPPTRSIKRRDTLRAARPQSIAIDGSSFWSWLEKKTERESQAQVADTRSRNLAPPAAVPQLPNPKRVCRYVDAGVQTEPDQDDLESTSTRSTRSRSSSTYSMQRISTSPPSIVGTTIEDPANPVIMDSQERVKIPSLDKGLGIPHSTAPTVQKTIYF